MSLQDAPAYCISLPHRMDRRQKAKSRLAKVGIRPTFIEAVKGSEVMTQEQYDNHICLRTKPEKGWSGGDWESPERIAGHIGCTLSHEKALKLAMMEHPDASYYLILEDDASPGLAFQTRWKLIWEELPEGWELLSLGSSPKRGSPRITPRLVKTKGGSYTHAYLVTRPAAELLADFMADTSRPADVNWDRLMRRGNSYTCWPPLVEQFVSRSDIEQKDRGRAR